MNAVATETLAWRARDVAGDLARAADAFRETRDARDMFADADRQQALDGLRRLADDGNMGCGLLTGGPGLGKTLLRSALVRQLDRQRCAVVVLETGLLGFDDLLLEILSQLREQRLTAEHLPGRYERIAEFKAALATEIAATGRHLVLLLDDADQLDPATLEAVGSLMNLASDRQSFVVPMLFGQPSLRRKLAGLPVLRQRIGVQFSLAALDSAGCFGYAAHRLERIGEDPRRVFESALLDRLHQASGGVPRVINALCRHALQHAAQQHQPAAGATCLEAARARLLEAGGAASPLFVGQ
jgi:type II secretory pathway predicted ATPase ExeA